MKHNQTIQIFSADHHKDSIYILPFIRVSDKIECPVNICNDRFLHENRDILSEVSRILYINKHLDDFGNPDYIGFCHYRRFFANLNIKAPLLDTNDLRLLDNVFNPIDQLALLQQNDAKFSFELQPSKMYQLIGQKMPFGCHKPLAYEYQTF